MEENSPLLKRPRSVDSDMRVRGSRFGGIHTYMHTYIQSKTPVACVSLACLSSGRRLLYSLGACVCVCIDIGELSLVCLFRDVLGRLCSCAGHDAPDKDEQGESLMYISSQAR